MTGVILSETCPVCYEHYEYYDYKVVDKTKMVLHNCDHYLCLSCAQQVNGKCPCCRAEFGDDGVLGIWAEEVDVDDEMIIGSKPI